MSACPACASGSCDPRSCKAPKVGDGRRARQRRWRIERKERAALDAKRLSWLGADDERLLDVCGYLQNEGGNIREAIDVLRVRQGT